MNELRELRDSWIKEVTLRNESIFVNFLISYMCLDMWMSKGTDGSGEKEKREWAFNDQRGFKSFLITYPDAMQLVDELSKLGPVSDMRNLNREPMAIEQGDPRTILEYIYRVRCNLFHGSKNPLNLDDKKKVEISNRIVEAWLQYIIR